MEEASGCLGMSIGKEFEMVNGKREGTKKQKRVRQEERE